MTAAKKADGLAALRLPFPPNQVSMLPKLTCKACSDKNCQTHKKIKCDGPDGCGSWISTAHMHLSYVGHAALSDRLLDVDLEWSWEPVAFAPDGLPAFDRNGGLWIRLTVCGVTRLGYGDAGGKTGPNAIKEAIGDALRNAGMRFGAALDLWHKGDLHTDEPEHLPDAETDQEWLVDWIARLGPTFSEAEFKAMWAEIVGKHHARQLSDSDRRDCEALFKSAYDTVAENKAITQAAAETAGQLSSHEAQAGAA